MTRELCVNIWIVISQDSGIVKSLGGRLYCLDGTDEQKTIVLKALSNSDFVMAFKMPIPDNYVVHYGDDIIKGAVIPSELEDMSSPIYEDLYRFLNSQKQSQLCVDGFDNYIIETISENPLYVVTSVFEDDFGYIHIV
jgi:hypothetical protein